jgi:hypothetical protein
MGRIFIVAGMSAAVYIYYTHSASKIIALAGLFFLCIGTLFYLCTDLK